MRVKLKDAFNLQMGKTPSRADLSMWGGNNKWISIADIGSAKKYISSTKECITDEGVSRSGIKVVPEGTVIMSFKLSIGKTAIVSEDMYTNEAIMAFIDNGTYCIDPNYLYHLCCGTDWTQGGNKAVMGLTLNKATLSEMEIELPTIEEQREIASILDQLDAIIEKRHDELNMIEQLVKSRFFELFGDINVNDKGWNIQPLGELCTIVRGGSPRPIEKYLGGDIPWIKIGDATDGENIYLHSTKEHIIQAGVSKSRMVKAGSLIFANCGVSLGFARIITFDGCIHDGWLAMEDIDERLDKVFLLQALNQMTDHFRRIAPAGTQPNLNTAIMKAYKQIIPPVELQREFIAFVEQTDKSKYFACQTLSFLLKLANNLQSWREKQYDY